jgi:hypothetical protein
MTAERPIYLVRLQPLPCVDAIKALRAALKSLLRQFGMRALSVELETKEKAHDRKAGAKNCRGNQER